MIRALATAFVVLSLVLAPSAPAAATTSLTASYSSNGLIGQLTLLGAGGEQFVAYDSMWRPVSSGLVTSDLYVGLILGAAPGPLNVRVGETLLLVDSREGMWE